MRMSSAARLVESVSRAQSSMIAAMIGSATPSTCGKRYYQTDGTNWTVITCPLRNCHPGLHADENFYPFFTSDDAEWSKKHYRLCNQ